MEIDELKATVCAEVDRWGDRLIDVAHQIHDHPELAYEEHAAHDLLTSVLDDAGLAPERAAFGVPTAFRASVGRRGRWWRCSASTTHSPRSATPAGTT